MKPDKVLALTDEELRIKVELARGATGAGVIDGIVMAYWPEEDIGEGGYDFGSGWKEVADYPHDIAAAWELGPRSNVRQMTAFRDSLYALAPDRAKAENVLWNLLFTDGARTITRAFVLAMTQEEDAK